MSTMKVLLLPSSAEAPLQGQRWPSPAADGEHRLFPRVLHMGVDASLE